MLAFNGAAAALPFAALEAVGLVAAVPVAARVALGFAAGAAFAAAARVPRVGFTTVVPVDIAEESEVAVCVDVWLALR